MKRKVDNYTFLTTQPVGSVIRHMAVPTIVSMLVISIYNIVDTYFVGLISTQATAAVGVAFPIMTIMQAIAFFLGQGSGTYISRQLGAQEHHHATRMAATAFYTSLVVGVIFAAVGLIFMRPLAVLFGSTPTILPYTCDYLLPIMLVAPFTIGSMVLNNQMRFQGNASSSMLGMMAGAVLNVALVPLFTFYFNMGILGTGVGTGLSQVAGFLVLWVMTRHGGNIKMQWGNIALRKVYFIEIIKGGTPSLTRQGLASVSTLLLNLAAGEYGDAAIAGMSIVTRVSFVVFAVIIGIGQGFQPFCGFNYGGKFYARVKEGYIYSLKLCLAFLLPSCVVGFIWAESVIDALRHDPHVVVVGMVALRWQILTWPLAAFITITNMCLQTSGRTLAANVLAAARNGICFIPLILLLPRLLGLQGVEMTQTVADVVSFSIAVPLAVHYFRSLSGIGR